MKLSKKQQQKLQEELKEPTSTRFLRFVKSATIVAIVLTIIILVVIAYYNIGNTNHQNNSKQLITVLIWMIIFSAIWCVIGAPIKRWFSPVIRKANKAKDFVVDTTKTFFNKNKTHNKQPHGLDPLDYLPPKKERHNDESVNNTNNDIYQQDQPEKQDDIKYHQDDDDDDLF